MRGAAALLLGVTEVNAYLIGVPWLENTPRAYISRIFGITEEANVYLRVFAPGSRGFEDSAGDWDGCSLEISPTIWKSERVECLTARGSDAARCDNSGIGTKIGGPSMVGTDLHDTSDVHFMDYQCPVTGGPTIAAMADANDGSAISVEVWHNKLTPVTDRRTDQLLGTCKLAFELIHQNPLRDSSVEDDCYVLDALQCDSTLRSSTTFGLKICVDQESPPPPPPPSPPPPTCTCPNGFSLPAHVPAYCTRQSWFRLDEESAALDMEKTSALAVSAPTVSAPRGPAAGMVSFLPVFAVAAICLAVGFLAGRKTYKTETTSGNMM